MRFVQKIFIKSLFSKRFIISIFSLRFKDTRLFYYQNPGLVNSSETFYRYLLMHIKEVRFYPHGSVIVHYNDVLNFVVIIHTGSAEVVAPDGSLITSLGPGR